MPISRLLAATLHFLASLTIVGLFFFIVIVLWYPQPYFSASGGLQGLIIIALVDLVLGPLITLIIYNVSKTKKELILDLGLIVIIQLSALFYGVQTVYTQRPIALVFWESKFYTVPAAELNQQEIASVQALSSQRPVLLYAEKPTSLSGLKSMLARVQVQRTPPFQQVDLYRPLKDFKSNIFLHNIDIEEVINTNSEMAEQLKILLSKTKTKQADNIYLALESKYQNIILVFNAEAEQIGFLKAPFKDQL